MKRVVVPRPTKVSTEKELANLRHGKAGPGRPRKTADQRRQDAELLTFFQSIVGDPVYRENYRARALAGKLHPALENHMLQMVGGKPKEVTEHTFGPAKIQIIHTLRAELPVKSAVTVEALPPGDEGDG